MDAPPPPHPHREISPAQRVAMAGIDEAMIRRLVHAFYGRIRGDAVLGPVFETAITDWDPHLATMVDFWSSIALGTGRYDGRPMPVHARLPIEAGHFQRWLALFEETLAEVCPPAAAAYFLERARTIARSFEMGIAFLRNPPGTAGTV